MKARFLLATLLMLGIIVPGFADLDIAVPPGSPLEWTLKRPIPTGIGKPGIPDKYANQGKGGQMTVTSKQRGDLGYGAFNLYDYFQVVSHDITQHIGSPNLTKGEKVEDPTISTGGGLKVEWRYPPEMPTELVWEAISGSLRALLHYETVSVPEIIARLVEIGEPSLVAAKFNNLGPVPPEIEKRVTEAPKAVPTARTSGDARKDMLTKLCLVELCRQFPHAFDPTYGRRIFAFPDETEDIIIELSKHDHLFVQRNATVALNAYGSDKATRALVEVFRKTSDQCTRFRALGLLVRRKEKSIVKDLLQMLSGKDWVLQAYAAYALGMIGEKGSAEAIQNAIRTTPTAEFYMSAIPALGRCGDRGTIEYLKSLRESIKKKVPTLMNITRPSSLAMRPKEGAEDPPGAKQQILLDLCTIAMAMLGDESSGRELLGRLNDKGLDDFFQPCYFFICDALRRMGPDGIKMLLRIAKGEIKAGGRGFGGKLSVDAVRNRALQNLEGTSPDPDEVAALAFDENPTVRTTALLILFNNYVSKFKETATKIVKFFAQGTPATPDQAFVIGTCLQLLGELEALEVDTMIAVVEKAYNAGLFARRESNNEADITKAKVQVYPPLLEIAIIELGRIGDSKAEDLLITILKGPKTEGKAEAAIALATLATGKGIQALLEALLDDDGWVRYCAARALKHVTGKEVTANWIFLSKQELKRHADKYRELIGQK